MVLKEEFTFDSRDMRTKIHAVKYSPSGEKKACLIIAHGMGEHIGRYSEIAEFLAEQGIVVAGADMLGHGKTVTDEKDFGYFCEQDPATVVVRDVHRLKKLIQAENIDLPVFVMGHSMGSFLIRNYIEMYGSGINGAVIMGSGTVSPAALWAGGCITTFLRAIHGDRYVSRFLSYCALGRYSKMSPNHEYPFEWSCSRPESRKENANDPLSGHEFSVNGYHTLITLVARSQDSVRMQKIPKDLPLFFVSGADDPVGDFGVGVKKAADSYTNIGLNNVDVKIYNNDRHEIYKERDRFDVMMDIIGFMKKTMM